jgi:hypothetical protein
MQKLGIFAKYWEAGQVKTRLAETEGAVRAAALYREFLRTSLQRFSGSTEKCVLAFTPRDRRNEFADLAGDDWELQTQADGDLGQRMKHFFAEAFHGGARQVVLIGSDTPTMPLDILRQAFAALDAPGVVLGPTSDGGYYLVGASRVVPDIFDGISWSTENVWTQTTERLTAADVAFHELPMWYDIDDRESLARLRQELTGHLPQDQDFADLRQVVLADDSR